MYIPLEWFTNAISTIVRLFRMGRPVTPTP
jgi:hypothetical protein